VKRSLLFPGLLLALTAAFTAVAPGCDRHGEGERCSRLNGDEDCNSPLVCTDGSILGRTSDVCCPADLTAATNRNCTPNTGTGGGGAGGEDTTTTTTTGTGMGGTGGTGGTTTAGAGGTGGATTTGGAGGTGGTTTAGGTGGM